MAGTAEAAAARGIVGINVTPMVDVVLVLLVIMMVSATYIVSQSLQGRPAEDRDVRRATRRRWPRSR